MTSPTRIELMSPFSSGAVSRAMSAAAQVPDAELLRRRPVRNTATLRWGTHQALQQLAEYEGRSLSNLIAHLLENACH